MKATGNFENTQHVDPLVALSERTRAHIDLWLSKFPADRKRSAVLQGLHAAPAVGALQKRNQAFLAVFAVGDRFHRPH